MSEGVEFTSTIDGKEVKLKLLVENVDIERRCDTEYHIAYTQLMQKGILPRATLEKQMNKLGIWTDEDEETLTTLQRQIVELQIQLEESNTHEDGLAIAKDMGVLRADCLKLIEAKAAVLSNSCESLADEIRRYAYLAYATVYAETNKRVFKDYHDFIMRADEQVATDAREKLLTIASKTFQDSLTFLPEIGYVKGVEKQLAEAEALAETKASATKKKAQKKTTKKTTKKAVTKKKTVRKKTTRKKTTN